LIGRTICSTNLHRYFGGLVEMACSNSIAFLAVAAAVAATGSASAADMAVRARPAAVDPGYNWSGFYIGGNAGYGWGERSGEIVAFSTGLGIPGAVAAGTIPSFFNLRPEGALGGVQAGYNWQSGRWVFGVETDIQAAHLNQSVVIPHAALGPFTATLSTASTDLDWFGTARGRVGYAWNQFLLYGTGGLAYGGVSDNATVATVPPPAAGGGHGMTSSARIGWAAGAGIEWAFRPAWSLKAEYMHVDLGGTTLRVLFPVAPINFIDYRFQHAYDVARVGINYKWGGGPVVAKY
jgi:outer membrane immunogenic protein